MNDHGGTCWAFITISALLTIGIATLGVTFMVTQPPGGDDVTIVANVGIVSIAIIWLMVILFSIFMD